MLIMMMLGITSLGLIVLNVVLRDSFFPPGIVFFLRDSLRLFCMHAPLITYVGENPFPKVFEMVCCHLQ